MTQEEEKREPSMIYIQVIRTKENNNCYLANKPTVRCPQRFSDNCQSIGDESYDDDSHVITNHVKIETKNVWK